MQRKPYSYGTEKVHRFEKDSVKRRVRGAFGFRAITLAVMMISVLSFGCLGRVAYIMTAKGEQYRILAANNQLRDTVIRGVRGTVYDCNMTPLVTSSSSWNLCVNSYKLNLAFKKIPEEKEKCFESLAKDIADITGTEKEKIAESFLKSNNPNVRLMKNIGSEKREE